MICEINKAASNGFPAGDVLRLKFETISGKDELGLGAGCQRVGPESGQRFGHSTRRAGRQVDVICLENTAPPAREIRLAGPVRGEAA